MLQQLARAFREKSASIVRSRSSSSALLHCREYSTVASTKCSRHLSSMHGWSQLCSQPLQDVSRPSWPDKLIGLSQSMCHMLCHMLTRTFSFSMLGVVHEQSTTGVAQGGFAVHPANLNQQADTLRTDQIVDAQKNGNATWRSQGVI